MKKTLSKAKNGKMVRTSAVDPEGNKIKQKTNTRTGVTKTVVKYSDPTSSGKRREVTREFSPKNLAVYKKNPKALEEDYGNKYKKGGAKKPLRKAQTGDTMVGVPSLRDVGVKNIYQGPLNKSDYENLNKLYPVNTETPRLESTFVAPKVMQTDRTVRGPKKKMYESAGNQYMKNRTENYLRSGKMLDVDYDGTPYEVKEKELYSVEGKKKGGATKSMMKKGGTLKKTTAKSVAMKKMKTGGMVNPNAKVSALKSAGSKGVKSGVNPKASASKKATGRSGGTSTAPKTATPKAKYGMMMKKKK